MNMQTVSQTVSQPVNLAKITQTTDSLTTHLNRAFVAKFCPGIVTRFIQQIKGTTAKWKLKAKTMTQLLKYEDVQARLQLSRSSVLRLIDQGLLERIYIFDAPRITDTAVETFIKNQTLATRRNQVGA